MVRLVERAGGWMPCSKWMAGHIVSVGRDGYEVRYISDVPHRVSERVISLGPEAVMPERQARERARDELKVLERERKAMHDPEVEAFLDRMECGFGEIFMRCDFVAMWNRGVGVPCPD